MVSRALGEEWANSCCILNVLHPKSVSLRVREGFLELWPNQTLCLVALDHTGKGCAVPTKAQTIPIRHTCLLSRISGNAASDKNIKDGVCAQIEKNFARAKWKVGFGSLSSWPNSKCFLLHPTVPCCYCTSSAEHKVFPGHHRRLQLLWLPEAEVLNSWVARGSWGTTEGAGFSRLEGVDLVDLTTILSSLSSLQKAVRVTTLMKRLRAPEQSGTATAQSASDAATPGAAGGAIAAAAGGAASASGASATVATEGGAGCAAKSDDIASADRSATPATDGSATPATDGSVTPATDGSITPATDGSVTPATDRSATPATDGRATPATEESTVPATQSSAMPAAKAAATPEPAVAQPDSTALEGATGQAPPSSKGEEATGSAQESQRVETS